ncbi:50S ribosomal protein L25/general stress protein Ctc [Corynebacterium sp. KPL2850]|uniref:50S ribosomal protein L25/general stress protein Ctc n=1 Tax=unclassified Corynebacterium TaxID=2624378 RepID=UPI0032EBAA4E
MAERPIIKAEPRTVFGKGYARRLRRDWKVPGVIYGSDQEPVHFAVPLLDIQSLVRNNGVNAVLELEIEGEQYLTMVKNVDQNVLTMDIDHVDLLLIKRGEKVEVEVPITLTGESAPGTMHIQDADVLMVEADVLSIPEEIELSIEGLEDGEVITAADVTMPEGTTLVADPETVILSISLPEVDEELEEAAEAAEEGGADAGADSVDEEGEGGSSESDDSEE